MKKSLSLICSLLFLTLSLSTLAGFDEGMSAYNAGNYAEALAEFNLLSAKGDARAQNQLGSMFESGVGVPQDYAQAAFWYRKAAEQGYANAQNNLGQLYQQGKGILRDYDQAFTWISKAAEQGYAEAQFNLGFMYVNNQGVPQDFELAAGWYRKAAIQGDISSQIELGYCYLVGRGVLQDYVQAYAWLNIAADHGAERAIYFRDSIVKVMNAKQLMDGGRLSQEYSKAYGKPASHDRDEQIHSVVTTIK